MRRLVLTVLLVLGFAAPAWAQETCTPNATNGAHITSATAATGFACTMSADDTVHVDASRVVIAGSMAMTTGGFLVDGGILSAAGTHTITIGTSGLVVDSGGTVELQGAEIAECHVIDEVLYSTETSGTHQVTISTDCDIANVSTTTDWVVWDWGTPPKGVGTTLNRIPVMSSIRSVDFNVPKQVYKPQHAAGIWHKIDTATAFAAGAATPNQLVIDTNFNSGAYQGTPYAGARYNTVAANPITISNAAEVDACVPAFFGETSELVFDNAFNVVTVDGDLGSRYVHFLENASTANACSGKKFKILDADDAFHSEATGGCAADATGGDQTCDRIVVAANVCGCTAGSAHISQGMSRGDTFKIVRPLVISGDVGADADGDVGAGIEVIGSGVFRANWVLFDRLGTVALEARTPNYARDQHIAIRVGGVAGALEHPTVEITNSAIMRMWPDGASDASVIGFNGGSTDLFFTNDGTLDATNVVIDKVFIADTEQNTVGGGDHGIYMNSAKNVNPTRLRIERVNDDGFGSFEATITGTATFESGGSCTMCLLYENISSTANSQQGFEIELPNVDLADGRHAQYALGDGWFKVIDSAVIGCQSGCGDFANTAGMHVTRSVFGSDNNAGTNFAMWMNNTGAGSDEIDNSQSVPSRLINSLIYVTNGSGTNNMRLQGNCDDSIITGWENDGTTTAGLLYTRHLEGCVVNFADETNTLISLNDAALGARNVFIKDSAFRSGNEQLVAVQTFADVAGSTVTIDGFFGMMTANTLIRGPFGPIIENGILTTVVSRLSNITMTQGGTPSASLQRADCVASDDCDLVWDNVIIESSLTTPGFFWDDSADTVGTNRAIQADDLQPDHDTDAVRIRNLIVDGANTARPARLGWSEFGWAHAMMGDGVIDQIENFSTDDLILDTGTVGSAAGPKAF